MVSKDDFSVRLIFLNVDIPVISKLFRLILPSLILAKIILPSGASIVPPAKLILPPINVKFCPFGTFKPPELETRRLPGRSRRRHRRHARSRTRRACRQLGSREGNIHQAARRPQGRPREV